MVSGGIVARVLHDAFADGERQVEAAKGGIALLEPGDDTQGVEIVVEGEAVSPKGAVESLFAGVAKGRMPDVVRQSQGFSKLRIESKSNSHGARNLRDLERVGEAAAEVVGEAFDGQAREDLRLAGQTAKGARVQDAGGVARKRGPVGVRRFVMGAARERAAGAAGNGDSRRQNCGEFAFKSHHPVRHSRRESKS